MSHMKAESIQDIYELSPMQQGMLFHLLFAPQSGAYNPQHSLILQGHLNVDAFKRSWQRIVDRHTTLRTSFHWHGLENPVQIVHRQAELVWDDRDLRSLSLGEQEKLSETLLMEDRSRGFDYSRAPLMHLTLVRQTEDRYQFIWGFPHLLLDGWSVSILLREVFATYEALRWGLEFPLEEPRPFRDYIAWLRQQDLSKAEEHWRTQLKGFSAPTPLRIGWSPGKWPEAEGDYGWQQIRVAKEMMYILESLARRNHLTLGTLLHGIWALLLSRYSGQEEVVFGSVVSGRPADLKGSGLIVGLFINTLPIRVRIHPDTLLVPWLKELQTHLAEIRQYEYTALPQIQKWSDVPRGMPLFENIVVFENYPSYEASPEKYRAQLSIGNAQIVDLNHYPLSVIVMPGSEYTIGFSYHRGCFDHATIGRILAHFEAVLARVAADSARTLADLSRLPQAEREKVVVEWNATNRDYPLELCVHELFEALVGRTPDLVAVIFEDQEVTYGELNARANQVAGYLRKLGVGPDVSVGICLERSVEMVIGLLGVLKAGGAYVPLDPGYPADRLGYMLEDAQVTVLLTSGRVREKLPPYRGQVLCLDMEWAQVAAESREEPGVVVDPRNLAYVIYTSGSTGRPKGVMVTHAGLSNYLRWSTEAYAPQVTGETPLHTSLSFDLTVTSLYPALLAGGRVRLLPEADGVEGLAENWGEQIGYGLVKLTPSHVRALNELVENGEGGMQALVIGGEALYYEELQVWRRQVGGVRLINEYGPTETVVGCCVYEVENECAERGAVPIGRPIANLRMYVVDGCLEPVPIEVAGELCIGGAGLARGYLNRPEMTAEKFVPDPLSGQAGSRLYRTADLGRWLANGELEYLGRIDHQVKIRSFRIELGEIEAVLKEHPSVKDAVVMAREQAPGENQLVAYLVPKEGLVSTVGELRRFAEAKLPAYMVPSAWVTLDALPLMPSGKLDRKLLASKGEAERQKDELFEPPQDVLELRLSRILEKLLGVPRIGIKDNFFDLGGHSLLALHLMIKLQKEFGCALPLATLLRAPTIEEIARILRRQSDSLIKSPVIQIQPGGTRPPFFCVHPGAGDVMCYTRVASYLGPDQPFYGIQDPGIGHLRIEDMAERYIEDMRRYQTEGPFYIGGWSFGGVVAFEIAHQLVKNGSEVAFLGILDAGIPGDEIRGDEDTDDTRLLAILARELAVLFGKTPEISMDDLMQMEPAGRIAFTLDRLKKSGIMPQETEPVLIERMLGLFKSRIKAVKNYSPKTYPGRITLFRASDHGPLCAFGTVETPAFDSSDPSLGWRQYSRQPLEVYEIPGDHASMLTEPHVRTLAERLKACLDAAHAQSGVAAAKT